MRNTLFKLTLEESVQSVQEKKKKLGRMGRVRLVVFKGVTYEYTNGHEKGFSW